MSGDGRLLCLGDVPTGEVTTTGVEDLALGNGQVDCLPDLVPWRRAVDMVKLVEVDVVRLETPQTGIECMADVECRQTTGIGPVAHRLVDLGSEDGLFPTATA